MTESCDDDSKLNLISHVDVKKVSSSDVDFLQESIIKSQEVFVDKIEMVHADGAYHSPDNQQYCTDENICLYLHAIQGFKGKYEFELLENQEILVWDTVAKENIPAVKTINKKGEIRWRIKNLKGYRYFTQKDINNYFIRKKIKETPIEILQKRNNVEATIFQLGYHYSNDKSRYRGLVKHQMWASLRCLWVNFVRILNHTICCYLKYNKFIKKVIKSLFYRCFKDLKAFGLEIILMNNNNFKSVNISISKI